MREELPRAEQLLQRGLDVLSAGRIVERTGDLRNRFPLVRTDSIENLLGQRSRRRFGEPGIGERIPFAMREELPGASNSCNAALTSFPRGESSSEAAISAADFRSSGPIRSRICSDNGRGTGGGNNAYVNFSPFPWTCSVPAATNTFSAFLDLACIAGVAKLGH